MSKSEPLKGKSHVAMEKMKDKRLEGFLADEVYRKEDIHSAVEWLKSKSYAKNVLVDGDETLEQIIDKAFEDVMKDG